MKEEKEELTPEVNLDTVLKATKKIFALYDLNDEYHTPDLFMFITKADDVWLEFHLLKWMGSVCNSNEVYVSYINESIVKWDGCSHINLYGEDALVEPADGYYHVCGSWSYANMINSYLMIHQVAYKELNNNHPESKKEFFEDCKYLNKLLEVFNKEYEIKEIDKSQYKYSIRDYD